MFFADWHRLVRRTRPGQSKELALFSNTQLGMRWLDHRPLLFNGKLLIFFRQGKSAD
jgi:hypothetical protein